MNAFIATLTVVLVGLIGVASVICAGFGFYLMVNALIDRAQNIVRRKRSMPMATPMDIDELQLRRLKKAVAIRIAQRKLANGK
jgi:hypothetical protein